MLGDEIRPERRVNDLGHGDSPLGGPLMSDANRPMCAIEGCTKGSRSRTAKWCEMHYHRWYEHGDPLYSRPRPTRLMASNGYVRVAGWHPLGTAAGRAYEHRAVLLDAIGAGSHPCHWCGRTIRWEARRGAADALTVDHVDHVRTNNDISNLVPSCGPCNVARQPNRAQVARVARTSHTAAYAANDRLLAINSQAAWDRATPEQRAERGRRVSEGKQRAAAARRAVA